MPPRPLAHRGVANCHRHYVLHRKPRPASVRCGLSTECNSYRVFFCCRCGKRVVICRHCDHGHCYCPDHDCGEQARFEAKRRYRADYQKTKSGRHNHAAAQARYRLKQARDELSEVDASDLVTDHGSTSTAPSTTMHDATAISAEPEEESYANPVTPAKPGVRCDFCGQCCGPYVHRWLGCWQ
jgi:hypothetical protein